MSSQTSHPETSRSYLDMSDDEISKFDITSLDASADEKEEDSPAADAELADTDSQDAVAEESGSDAEDATDVAKEAAEDKEDDAAEEDAADEAGGGVAKASSDATEAEKAEKKEVKPVVAEEAPAVIDYEKEYKRLLTPFKANGKDIAVGSIDDAISLMQMGANYNKKMAALKPNLKLMKLLENSGMLNEDKISFLIDLENKNPAAINKLIKDSGVDPMDLDAEKASGYKPTTYKVDDRELELDAVLDEIQGTPSYNRTLDIVSTKWDGPSKQVIAGSPQLLKVINDHVQSGIYDTIIKEMDNERMFGRLNGLSDIEAYRKVGDQIDKRGGFGNSGHQAPPTLAKLSVMVPKANTADEDKLKNKRRAAGSTKPAGSSAAPKDFNPLSMSDEEFTKQAQSKFL